MSYLMTATPLQVVNVAGLGTSANATIIQWHVVAMFLPSFFSGSIITRIGALRVLWVGVFFYGATIYLAVGAAGFWPEPSSTDGKIDGRAIEEYTDPQDAQRPDPGDYRPGKEGWQEHRHHMPLNDRCVRRGAKPSDIDHLQRRCRHKIAHQSIAML